MKKSLKYNNALIEKAKREIDARKSLIMKSTGTVIKEADPLKAGSVVHEITSQLSHNRRQSHEGDRKSVISQQKSNAPSSLSKQALSTMDHRSSLPRNIKESSSYKTLQPLPEKSPYIRLKKTSDHISNAHSDVKPDNLYDDLSPRGSKQKGEKFYRHGKSVHLSNKQINPDLNTLNLANNNQYVMSMAGIPPNESSRQVAHLAKNFAKTMVSDVGKLGVQYVQPKGENFG